MPGLGWRRMNSGFIHLHLVFGLLKCSINKQGCSVSRMGCGSQLAARPLLALSRLPGAARLALPAGHGPALPQLHLLLLQEKRKHKQTSVSSLSWRKPVLVTSFPTSSGKQTEAPSLQLLSQNTDNPHMGPSQSILVLPLRNCS